MDSDKFSRTSEAMSFKIFVLLVICQLQAFAMFRNPFKMVGARTLTTNSSQAKGPFQLVLIRHGESTWNDLNKFTGWFDCPLSQKGRTEAISAGKLLREGNFKFDLAYTSYLQRAIKTLWYSLEETGQMHIPIRNAWQLNER